MFTQAHAYMISIDKSNPLTIQHTQKPWLNIQDLDHRLGMLISIRGNGLLMCFIAVSFIVPTSYFHLYLKNKHHNGHTIYHNHHIEKSQFQDHGFFVNPD